MEMPFISLNAWPGFKDMLHSAPANLKSNVWKRFGFYKKARKLDESAAVCKHGDVIVLPCYCVTLNACSQNSVQCYFSSLVLPLARFCAICETVTFI